MWMRFKPSFVVLLTFFLALSVAAQSVTPGRQAQTVGVGSISMTVADLNRSVEFYTHVLTFQRVDERRGSAGDSDVRVAQLKLGDERIKLIQSSSSGGRPIPADSRSNDHWFQHVAIIVSNMDRAYAVLRSNQVRGVSPTPQRLPDWNRHAAGIRAYYFLDPDGHPLEILQFPPDKGAARWHRKDRLFLGIDHTAIVVTNTDASLRFYRDVLGLRVVGAGDNYGPEQAKLNNVPGAHLRITTLRADAGPGIELLEYIAPRGGRDLPFEPRLSDLVHRHTTIYTSDVAAVEKMIQDAGAAPMPKHIDATGALDSFFVNDPDGHELFIRREKEPEY